MGELKNCPTCGEFFNYTGLRDVCNPCAMNEEKQYEMVYRFLRRIMERQQKRRCRENDIC